ncbi:Pre-mRNA-splicing factor cwc26 [Sorochytrium milnesiophthora]
MASKEYLARYLSGPADTGKVKRKKKREHAASTTRVIDEEEQATSHWQKSLPRGGIRDDDDDDQPSFDDAALRLLAKRRAAGLEDELDVGATSRRQRHDSSDEEEQDKPKRVRHDSDSETDDGHRRPDANAPAERDGGPTNETVYRDKSGRKITVHDHQRDVEAQRREIEDKARKEKEWRMGRVQRQQVQEQRAQMQQSSFSRYADDKQLNQNLKQVDRWGDPLANFGKNKARRADPNRPTYAGAWAPNRYMIRPGFRWDGVDRSNGYEGKLLLKQNERAHLKEAAYKWSSEDM